MNPVSALLPLKPVPFFRAAAEAGWIMELSNTTLIIADQSELETTVTLKWIAQRVHMRTWTHISKGLYQAQRKPKQV